MPKMVFVNLPVADVEKSAAFYEAIGFTKDARFSQAWRSLSDGVVRYHRVHDLEPRALRRVQFQANRRCEQRGRDDAVSLDRASRRRRCNCGEGSRRWRQGRSRTEN